MKISLCSVPVQDQQKALEFYTEVLGFEKKVDIPAGDHRWLTVVSPDAPDGTQLVLEPNLHGPSQTWQKALHSDGIPVTGFEVDDIAAETDRLKGRGVKFTTEPMDVGEAILAVFDDTCGNLIQIYQSK